MDHPRLPPEWTAGDVVGTGSFSTVREATHSSGLRAVVKTTRLRKGESRDPARLALFAAREAAALARVDAHPAVPAVYDAREDGEGGEFSLVMERAEGEELFEYLKRQPGSRLDEVATARIMRQLLSALDFMHRRCVLHRDIKLDNLILDPATFRLRIIDFNLSTFFLPSRPLSEPVGCIHYASPALLLAADKRPYLADAGAPDVWAAGVVCYGLLAGFFPFRHTQPRRLHREILATAPGNLEFPEGLSPAARAFVARMLDPLRPATAAEMLSHPFLTGADLPPAPAPPAAPHAEDPVADDAGPGRPASWACDTEGVTDAMAADGDWRRQERACARYFWREVEGRRRRLSAGARRPASSAGRHPSPAPADHETLARRLLRLTRRRRVSDSSTAAADSDAADSDAPCADSDAETLAHDTVHSRASADAAPASVVGLFARAGVARARSDASAATAAEERGEGGHGGAGPEAPAVEEREPKEAGKVKRRGTLLGRLERALGKG